jgi:hypothetical protein
VEDSTTSGAALGLDQNESPFAKTPLQPFSRAGLSIPKEEVIEFYATREEAEEAVRQVLTDEPEWVGLVGVEAVSLAEASDVRLN